MKHLSIYFSSAGALALSLLTLYPSSVSASCSGCDAPLSTWKENHKAQLGYEDLLDRNKKFLEGPGGQEPSKAIKARSNVLVLLLKIDASKNFKEAAEKDLKKQCPTCNPGAQP